jgi:hypothetical protein
MVDRQDVDTWLWSVNCLVRINPIATAGNRRVINLAEEVIEGIHDALRNGAHLSRFSMSPKTGSLCVPCAPLRVGHTGTHEWGDLPCAGAHLGHTEGTRAH